MPDVVLFYISGHGFGHASRQVEIIRSLVGQAPHSRIVIRSAVSSELLARTLDVPFELHPGICDTGIVQRSSIEHDDEATVRDASAFYERYDDVIAHEIGTARAIGCDLIVSDIAPVAFEVAARLGTPAVAIGNFTWDWIYETHPGMTEAAPWLPARLRASYAKATLALQLPFAGGFEVFPFCRRTPLVARRATRTRADTRRFLGLPLDRRAALLSFGGYGLPGAGPGAGPRGGIDFTTLDCTGPWTVVTTDRTRPGGGQPESGDRVITIDERAFERTGFRYEDLVAAVDVVITKPGYGVVAECISTGTSMLYTSRGIFREYDLFVREMPRYLRARFIGQEDLLAGRWLDALEALVCQPDPPERLDTGGADDAARQLVAVLRGSGA